MKYIYYIFGIIVLLTGLVWGSALLRPQPEPGADELAVNNLRLSAVQLQQRWQQRPYHQATQKEFLAELVSQQLLVDQAIKLGVANEQAFKNSVQTFFEQSLVRTLLERKIAELKIAVSDDEVAAWRQVWNQNYHLTLIRTGNSDAATGQESRQSLQQTFSVLPDALKLSVMNLQPGELSAPISDGDGFLQLRLERIEAEQTPAASALSDAQLEQHLRIAKQQQALDSWMVALKEQARISYPETFVQQEAN